MFEFFSTTGFRAYLKKAKQILADNWTGSYTRPSAGLYPHQWSWDSAFIAMGLARYDHHRAMAELRHLFGHQWPNGMVPQIVFNPKVLGSYFPEPDFWQVPEGRGSSGITMPPLHAVAVWRIFLQAGGAARDFLAEMYPKLKAYHAYLYRERDPDNTGLVYIRHPWESGLDNSPSWDGPLERIEIDHGRLPVYQRRDLDHGIPAQQRPSDYYYDRYVYLVDLFRRAKYDEAAIRSECPFLVQDVLFNSILCRANHALVQIGKQVGQDVSQPQEWLDATSKAIQQNLWCAEHKQFGPYDLVGRELLNIPTAAGFMPLFAVAADGQQAQILYERANSVSFCALHQGNCFTVPNYDMARDDFDSRNYWRGPVWININWMLSQGMKSYGFREKADAMKKDMIQLPVRFGFYEYYDSITGAGYGSDNFSWTAALFIDLVDEYYDKEKNALHWLGGEPTRKLYALVVLNDLEPSGPGGVGDLGSKLLTSINQLKQNFYDMHRGLVDYQAMRRSSEYFGYTELAARLKDFDPACLVSREDKLAFWINLYNTIVVHGIVELELESSVREVENFFSHICYQVGEHQFSPDDIEHGILRSNARPPYRVLKSLGQGDQRAAFALEQLDPRIHFALVCGSRSCAPIEFYQAERIDLQLDLAASHFINSSEVVVLPEQNKVMLSQIFNWYQRDFGGKKGVFDFLLKYMDDEHKVAFLKDHAGEIHVEYLFYDWNLNH
ncbi:MAG: DUF547 domain-containing protein [Deltaproteobacteria bacterium]|nr:DUF547 domain-containing protein [Deltaproteobacteria bacterium]